MLCEPLESTVQLYQGHLDGLVIKSEYVSSEGVFKTQIDSVLKTTIVGVADLPEQRDLVWVPCKVNGVMEVECGRDCITGNMVYRSRRVL